MATVLITGCRSGIGYHTALTFGRRGDTVYATMRDPSVDGRLQQVVERESLPVVIHPLDVTDGTGISELVANLIAGEGAIDVLVNNAGIGFAESIEELDEWRARLVWETNFWGPLRLSRSVLPHMRSRRSGFIINVSSQAAHFPGGPWLAMYSNSKIALSSFTQSLDTELAGTGVRAVSIEPGYFATEIYGDRQRAVIDANSPYAAGIARADAFVAAGVAGGDDPQIVADAIVAVVQDPQTPVRVVVGDDAKAAWDAYRRATIEKWRLELDS
jgi:NAD(P)-dependent dehydrogenase (short-subunit alcohol dehydrogenase family)